MSGVPARLARDRAAVVVIDVQDGFRAPLADFDRIAERCALICRGARVLGLPIVATEQYPEGLGATTSDLASALAPVVPLPKLALSAARADGFDLGGRDQALVCGIETHICIAQTALDLLAVGVDVHVAADATGARATIDHETALERIAFAGAVVTTGEAALFELLGEAGTPEFRAVQRLVVGASAPTGG